MFHFYYPPPQKVGTILMLVIYTISIFLLGRQVFASVSEDTEACLMCHETLTPGIVADWRNSRHASVLPSDALMKDDLSRRMSADSIPDNLKNSLLGCAECHMLNNDAHADTFEHNGYKIHTVVTPEDCMICHPTEYEQFEMNLMSFAHINLTENSLYDSLAKAINGLQDFHDMEVTYNEPTQSETNQSCLYCHGTKVEVAGFENRETDFGEMTFPILTGWPNQGVGRINPDGSRGGCSACHARHQFSIEVARKPATCSECHKGPDVPAYKVYKVSKHGNIYSSLEDHWNFDNVPWTVGQDYTAPTCAACHVSLVVNEGGDIIIDRSHRMNDRLDKRIFGLIYAHPHPLSPNTSEIVNSAGIPLPTELTGEPVEKYLISEEEQAKRRSKMKSVCRGCHSVAWTDGHFAMLDSTIEATNHQTLTATLILTTIWENGLAEGLPQNKNIFDEAVEKKWVAQWLFYANSTRFAAAMAGADYGVFANGRWKQAENIQDMYDWLEVHMKLKEDGK